MCVAINFNIWFNNVINVNFCSLIVVLNKIKYNLLMKKYDVLIIGAGIAGHYAAMNIPKEKKV
jgi:ribulose 1,5-bisphosphate synthetase/thiazole synthase